MSEPHLPIAELKFDDFSNRFRALPNMINLGFSHPGAFHGATRPHARFALNSPQNTGATHTIFGGLEIKVLISSEETRGAFTLLDTLVPAGTYLTPHAHAREDETYYVLEGEFKVQVDRHVSRLRPGSEIFLPRGVPHSFELLGSKWGRVLVTATPGGIERWIAELSEVRDHESEFVQVIQISERHGIELLAKSR